MTSIPSATPTGWLLRVSATSAPADPENFEQQRQLLRAVAGFDPNTRIWTAYIGQLDIRALDVLQQLYDAARRFSTEVHLEPVAAPSTWEGPTFTADGDVAALLAARADQGRALGQLHIH
ncbi:hypothetical protein OG413_43660 [Streptomyces sp. NBC_01433]|uniref:hypothetical protein n=1 Tax=Streptomyces sp. NBC_01433 TaxID=2903864 RepID=UPI002257E6AF|nr:hypothetical protein [Streptomyces sp. NBC_01433]MCX4682082.1 hypothetical protein [Streptomyces sp. NBC_01433]